MKTTNRWLWFTLACVLAFMFAPLLALPALAQTNSTSAGSGGSSAFASLQWIVPLAAPVLVMLIKKVPGWFESKFSKNLLPYVCVAVAILLMLVLDLFGKLSVPLWIAGPVAGAVGIGSRELLDRGLVILGLKTSTDTTATPETPTQNSGS